MIRDAACRWCFLIFVMASVGCLPSTRVIKNPGPDDSGVRFYRPKPYLFVQPMVDRTGTPVDGFVTIDTVTLPDFSEEYSIQIRSGFGTNETRVTLADGWRLEGLNVDLDSSTDENLEAVADLVGLVPTLTSGRDGEGGTPVRASNVPLGYYEAVISRGPDCQKRLYGFRYVGFMPYAACPLESAGVEPTHCFGGDVFALTFERGEMVFRPLHQIAEVPVGNDRVTE